MNERYAVIDIETTGGMFKRDRVTEVGIVLMENGDILDTYSSLVNPERSIPEIITRITGIDDELVADAPRFYEIAKDIVEWTDNAFFVAHNVDFDYRFLRNEFARLGYTYSRKKLCTIKLSKKFFPDLPSYSLGNLIRHFEIEVDHRHRALDDALAAAEVFKYIWKYTGSYESIRQSLASALHATRYPLNISQEKLDAIPDECGLYYFTDRKGKVIYIGKSKNIRKRIKQHFAKNGSKAAVLREKAYDVSWDLTGSELLALLRESDEIKEMQPEINRAQRQKNYPYALKTEKDHAGYNYFKVSKKVYKQAGNTGRVLNTYRSENDASRHADTVLEDLELCPCIGNRREEKTCIRQQLKLCCGAGKGQMDAREYNESFKMAEDQLDNYFHKDFLILEDGPKPDSRVVFGIRDGEYQGYVVLDKEDSFSSPIELFDMLQRKRSNKELQRIIFHYLQSKKHLEVIDLSGSGK